MKPDTYSTDRRTVLRGAAGAAGIASVGGLGLLAASPASGAHANGGHYTISGTSLTNDDGDLLWVMVDASTDIRWSGFDVPVTHIGFSEFIRLPGSGLGYHPYWGLVTDWSETDGVINDLGTKPIGGNISGQNGGPFLIENITEPHEGTSGTTGHVFTGGTQVIVAEGGDESVFDLNPDLDTDPADWDEQFEGADGETVTTTVEKIELAHLYTSLDDGTPHLIHPDNYGWAPTPVVVRGEFDVTVTNKLADTSGSTGSGESTAG